MSTINIRFRRSLLALGLGLCICTSAVAADGDRPVSRHTFRSSGTADELARVPVQPADVQIVRGQPLKGDDRAISSTSSAFTSDLLTGDFARAPLRAATATLEPVALARQATPLVVGAPTATYVTPQLALAAHRVQTVAYGNTYGTYSAASYHGRLAYSHVPRTYYNSSRSYGHVSASYYGGSRYCGGGYYNRGYYGRGYYGGAYYGSSYYSRPSYGYCAPTYYSPSYSYYGGYYNNYYRPSFGFSYGYGSRCGSSFGISIGW